MDYGSVYFIIMYILIWREDYWEIWISITFNIGYYFRQESCFRYWCGFRFSFKWCLYRWFNRFVFHRSYWRIFIRFISSIDYTLCEGYLLTWLANPVLLLRLNVQTGDDEKFSDDDHDMIESLFDSSSQKNR